MMLRPGDATLADWREIYRGAAVTLDPASQPDVAASAEAVARILAEDAPIYGINTGFGRLGERADSAGRPGAIAAQHRAVARCRHRAADAETLSPA